MGGFENIKRALEYIDDHLDEALSVDSLAGRFHFSTYYFHRMFTIVVGKPVAAHIRARRLHRACLLLTSGDESIVRIGMDCGFNSAQAFSRAFRAACGVSPSEYRRRGHAPAAITVDELVMRFTNRLRGGLYLNPKIIKRGALYIAGVRGDGSKTAEVWNAFEKLVGEKPLGDKLSGNGYEVRMFGESAHTVHVGHSVPDETARPPYGVLKLPASHYAVFDVYVANGYQSENSAMEEWLATNTGGFTQRLLQDAYYCVECYDERFSGDEAGSIVEIWLPIEKRRCA